MHLQAGVTCASAIAIGRRGFSATDRRGSALAGRTSRAPPVPPPVCGPPALRTSNLARGRVGRADPKGGPGRQDCPARTAACPGRPGDLAWRTGRPRLDPWRMAWWTGQPGWTELGGPGRLTLRRGRGLDSGAGYDHPAVQLQRPAGCSHLFNPDFTTTGASVVPRHLDVRW